MCCRRREKNWKFLLLSFLLLCVFHFKHCRLLGFLILGAAGAKNVKGRVVSCSSLNLIYTVIVLTLTMEATVICVPSWRYSTSYCIQKQKEACFWRDPALVFMHYHITHIFFLIKQKMTGRVSCWNQKCKGACCVTRSRTGAYLRHDVSRSFAR